MLQIGNDVLTAAEEKSHFALWAFAKAPLIIGCDLTTASEDSLAVLMNKPMIDINQDAKGQQATCVYGCVEGEKYHIYQTMIYLAGSGAYNVMMVINWDDADEITATYDPVAMGSADDAGDNCVYYDLYDATETAVSQKGTVFSFPNPIAAHDHVAYKVKCLPW